MRVRQSRQDDRRIDVKMTPMIDIVFLLLIFFLCTASFQIVEKVLPTPLATSGSVQVPQEIDPELAELEEVVVRLQWDAGKPTWMINRRVYESLDEVRQTLSTLAELQSDLPVILDVAGQAPLGSVVDLYDICRMAGFEKVQFAASIKV